MDVVPRTVALNKSHLSKTIIILFVIYVAYLIVGSTLSIVLANKLSFSAKFCIYQTAAIFTGLLFITIACKLLSSATLCEALSIHRVSIVSLILWSIFAALVYYLSVWINFDITHLDDHKFETKIFANKSYLPLLLVVIVLLAPLFEEVLFRGFLFNNLMQANVYPAVVILATSIIWATLHLQYSWPIVLSIVIIGILLGYARWQTRSIITSLAMHSIFNLLQIIGFFSSRI